MLGFIRRFLPDLISILIVFVVAYILIGNYISFEFLNTGYLDWFMHLYRVKLLDTEGLASWNPSWSNGFNLWYSYQFVSHLIVLGISKLFTVTYAKAMIFSIVAVFLLVRFLLFGILRSLHISRTVALFITIVSFAYAHQWISINDFSIYIPMIALPILTYIWIQLFSKHEYHYFILFSALAGISWIFHPVLGYTMSGLYFIALLVLNGKISLLKLLSGIIFYVVSAIPFVLPVLNDASFRSPYMSSPQFLRELVTAPYAGLSFSYMLLIIGAFFLWIGKLTRIPLWATVLYYYCLTLIGLIFLSFTGSLPIFLNALQIPRAITFIGLLILFPIAQIIHTNFPKPSRVLVTLAIIASTILIGTSIDMASQYMAEPSGERTNILHDYFKDNAPVGTIYYERVTEANYFANSNLRFVTSYAEHMEPHPLSIRFKMLIEQTQFFVSIPEEHIETIEAYAQVLGVEYLFLPAHSPLIEALTSRENAAYKIETENLSDTNGTYTVLRADFLIANAYLLSPEIASTLGDESLTLPTIDASTYQSWDEEIMRVNNILASNEVTPLPLEIARPNNLYVEIPEADNRAIYINQSFSENWKADSNTDIGTTALRFMKLSIPNEFNSTILTLRHSWENWYWPSHVVALTATAIALLFFSINKIYKND